ncbi:MAG: glycosyltransferase, partial [Myxococcota bacterium]
VIGAALADDDAPAYVLLLNPDTRIHRGAIERLRAYLEDQPHVGIAGSRLEDPDGTPQVSAFRFPSVASEFLEGLQWNVASRLLPERDVAIEPPPATAGPVDWVAGASMMIRRQVFEAVGLLDEGYFLYFEEVDFCLKARRAQWATHYVPDSRVIHYIGQSTGVSDERRARPRLPRYWFESRERFFMNNHGHIRRRLADAAFACGFAAFRLRQRIQRKPDREPPRRWRDFVKYNFIPEWEAPRRPSGPSRGGRPAVQDRGRYNENPPDIGLIDLLVEDFKTYDRNVWEQGLWAIAVHRLGNARMSVRFLPVRAALSLSYKAAFKGVEIATGITLPYTVQVGRRVRIWHHGCMILHAESIGDDVTIRQNTTMGVRRTYENEDLPIIGHRVDLAAGVSI